MRLMGLDVGEVRIGVAVSDETELIAQGVSTLHRVGWKKDLPALLRTVEAYQISKIVVGYPINMDGTAGRLAVRRGLCDRDAQLPSGQLFRDHEPHVSIGPGGRASVSARRQSPHRAH